MDMFLGALITVCMMCNLVIVGAVSLGNVAFASWQQVVIYLTAFAGAALTGLLKMNGYF
jgi:hypothetical protein